MSTYEDFEDDTVTLTFDDDKEVECGIVAIFPAGEREYIALLPLGGEEEENGEVYIYRYSEDADGEPSIDNIEDDDEYEIASDAFARTTAEKADFLMKFLMMMTRSNPRHLYYCSGTTAKNTMSSVPLLIIE